MRGDPWSMLPLTDLSYQILLALARRPAHGYAVLRTIAARTDGRLEPASGTLYTAIRRLERDGLVRHDGAPEGRRGRVWALTSLGREVLRLESERLAALVAEARRSSVLPARGEARGEA